MTFILRLILVVSSLFIFTNARAATCEEEVATQQYYCDRALEIFADPEKAEIEVQYVNGGFNVRCHLFAGGEVVSLGWSQIYCEGEAAITETMPVVEDPVIECGSIILKDNQVLGETIPVVGAKFNLAYFTNKVPGRVGDYKIKIPLTKESVDSKLKSVKYTVKINGSVVESKTLPIKPNLSVDYAWDGVSQGQVALGSGLVEVVIEQLPGGKKNSFSVALGSLQAKSLGFGGWIPTNYHFYDLNRRQILRGDGSSLSTPTKVLDNGQLLAVDTDRSLVYIFDASTGKHLRTKSFWLGADLFVFYHDQKGVLTSIQEPFGIKTVFNRNGNGDIASITAPNGQQTLISLDTAGYISSVKSPAGTIHSMTYYDAKGLLKTFKKPQGQISTFVYDSIGNLIQDIHSGGYELSLEKSINEDETIISSKTKMGRVTSSFTSNLVIPNHETEKNDYVSQRVQVYPDETVTVTWSSPDANVSIANDITYSTKYKNDERFQALARVTESKSVSGAVVLISQFKEESFTYDDESDPFSISSYELTQSDQDGEKSFTTTYDGSTRTFISQSNRGEKITTIIDSLERVVSIQAGTDLPTVYTYNKDQLVRVTQGSRFVEYTYDATTRQLSEIKDAQGNSTKFNYDSAGKLISKVNPEVSSVTFDYDDNDNLVAITPSGKTKHSFVFNALELLTSYLPPVLGNSVATPTLYEYNEDKQLLTVTDPDGTNLVYNYDQEKGTLDSIETKEGVYTFSFNPNTGKYDQIRTPKNFLTQKLFLDGALVRDFTRKGSTVVGGYGVELNSRGFKARDYIQGENSEGGLWIDYSTAKDGKVEVAGFEQISYYPDSGRIKSTIISEGPQYVTESFKYNPYGELSSYSAQTGKGTIYSLSLNYDDLARIIRKSEVVNGVTHQFDYSYDLSGRLIEVKLNGKITGNYKYDSNGNRISGVIGEQKISATYDSQDRLVTYNSESFEYALNGNLQLKKNTITNQVTPFTFNSFGQLTSVKVGATTYGFEIDGLGRRIQNTVNGKLKDSFVYMDQLRVAGLIGPDGKVLQHYIYATKPHVPDYILINGDAYRIITDHLGSVRLVIKVADGSIVQEMLHDEFGRVTKDTNKGFQPFGFAGGLYDSNTGLVQFGARWYDPQIGRWISKDPIKFQGGYNFYVYVLNNPINLIDRTGLAAQATMLDEGGQGGGGGGVILLPGKELIDWFQNKSKMPTLGNPDSKEVVSTPEGDKLKERTYDEKGKAKLDIDWDHDHGHGVPHVHDWTWPEAGGNPKRGPGRQPKPGECD